MTVSDAPSRAEAALDVMMSRTSNNMLTEPVPDRRDLELIIGTATHAPDHGKLRPWRFVVIQGEAREKLADVIAEAMQARDPNVTEKDIRITRNKFLMQPMIIAVGAKITEGKIPEIEQVLSAGAAAMNVLNAIHALGYAGKWVTGANCYDAKVNEALGFRHPDRLVGLIYVGTEKMKLPEMERPSAQDIMSEWTGPVG